MALELHITNHHSIYLANTIAVYQSHWSNSIQFNYRQRPAAYFYASGNVTYTFVA